MSVRIIEKKLLGKKNNSLLCEDGIVVTDDIVAVIDGATSKGNSKFNNKSGGRLAMEVISKALYDIDKTLSSYDKLELITRRLKSYKDSNNITFPLNANIVFYDAYNKSIVAYGDCKALLNGTELIEGKRIDIITANKRADYLHKCISSGASIEALLENDLGREYILPDLLQQERIANIEYPFINGTPIKKEFINVFKVNTNDEVVLASDGYPKLRNTLKESEAILEELISNDPLCTEEFKSTKGVEKGNISFDDRAYIRFIVE